MGKYTGFALTVLIIGLLSVNLVGCDSAAVSGEAGRVVLRLTDMPFPFDDALAANVSIQRIEIRGSDSTESVVLLDSVVAFNLLELRNGVTATLADVPLPHGRYHQLRVIVGEDAAVIMKDSTVFDLKVPSGSQTGIKMNLPDFVVDEATDEAEVVVDFDVGESFVVRGNPNSVKEINGFIFKPVLKVQSFEFNGVAADTSSAG